MVNGAALADFNGRLADASARRTAHIGTAQAQMHKVTGHLLAGFADILSELDQPVIPPAHHGTAVSGVNIDARATAQDETRCVDLGMPKKAIARGAVHDVMSIGQIDRPNGPGDPGV